MSKFNKRKFVIIPDNMILDKNVSFSAIGVFAFLSSFEDGDEIPDLKHLKNEITELENNGYLKVEDKDIYLEGV